MAEQFQKFVPKRTTLTAIASGHFDIVEHGLGNLLGDAIVRLAVRQVHDVAVGVRAHLVHRARRRARREQRLQHVVV